MQTPVGFQAMRRLSKQSANQASKGGGWASMTNLPTCDLSFVYEFGYWALSGGEADGEGHPG